MCLFCSYCLLVSFSFFPGWRSVCPEGYAALAQVCLWEYRSTVKLTLSASSQAIWAQMTGGLGALLVSPFNVKWRFSLLAGGVEGSKFCLFLVILPAKCICSVSPRFHYRRLAFCFLPLAAILESPHCAFDLCFPDDKRCQKNFCMPAGIVCLHLRKAYFSQMLVAYTCHPSYSGDRDQEDPG
jgi:hypothetical protein